MRIDGVLLNQQQSTHNFIPIALVAFFDVDWIYFIIGFIGLFISYISSLVGWPMISSY